MSNYLKFYWCKNHKWVKQEHCIATNIGFICGICQADYNRLVKVRTRPNVSPKVLSDYWIQHKERHTVDVK
jgi:hypothetical protein